MLMYMASGPMRELGRPAVKFRQEIMKATNQQQQQRQCLIQQQCQPLGFFLPLRGRSSRRCRAFAHASSASSAGGTQDHHQQSSKSPNATAIIRHQRYAVVGGGFAGVAVAWHLLVQHCLSLQPAHALTFGNLVSSACRSPEIHIPSADNGRITCP